MKFIVAVSAFFLASCGFQPVYGTKQGTGISGGVRVETPRDAIGHQLKASLEDALNPYGVPENPAYKLQVAVSTSESPVGVARDGTVGRYNMTLGSSYTLTDLSDNKIVQKGEVYHVSSFNNQSNQYLSAYVSKQDAIKRGMIELGQLYRQRVGAWAAQKALPL